jgi:hypothetical protein
MKRNYVMMAMAAAMLASCAQTGLVEEIAEEPQKAIGFSTFVDKATRAADQAENSTATYEQGMNIHHGTFKVSEDNEAFDKDSMRPAGQRALYSRIEKHGGSHSAGHIRPVAD